MKNYYLGIDPGAEGGLALLGEGPPQVSAMPKSVAELSFLIDELAKTAGYCIVERIWGYAGAAGSHSSTFKQGVNYGHIIMAVHRARIPFEEVTPLTWQRGLSIVGRKKSETKTAWKRRLRDKAQQLFPHGVVKKMRDQYTPTPLIPIPLADSLLIAEWARQNRAKHIVAMAPSRYYTGPVKKKKKGNKRF